MTTRSLESMDGDGLLPSVVTIEDHHHEEAARLAKFGLGDAAALAPTLAGLEMAARGGVSLAAVTGLFRDIQATVAGSHFIDVSPPAMFALFPFPAASEIPRLQFLFGHWLLRGAVTIVAATGASGKTSLMAGVAAALSSGRAFLGKPLYEGAVRVGIHQLEDDHEQVARQITAAMIAHNIAPEDCADRLFVASSLGGLDLPPVQLLTAIQEDGNFKLLEETFERIEAEVRRLRLDVLIIDPFVSSHRASENSTEAIDAIVKRWALLAKRCNIAMVIVHHTRKTGGEKADVESVRGAIAATNAARIVLILNRMTEGEAAAFGLADDERRRMFSVDMGKANRSAPEAVEWFRLESVSLGNGHGEPDDEVGAVIPWSAPNAGEGYSRMELELVRVAVGNGRHREASASPQWVGHAIGNALGIDASRDPGKARIKLLIRTWLNEGKMTRVERYDERQRKVFSYVELGQTGWFEEDDWS